MRFACLLGAVIRLAAESPGREHQLPEFARVDRGLGAAHRLRVAVVEVDAEERAGRLCRGEQLVGFGQFEDQRLLDQERDAGPEQAHRHVEMALIGQADGDELGGGIQKRVELGVGGRLVSRGPRLGPRGIPPENTDQLGVWPVREDPGVLLAPSTGADDADPQRFVVDGIHDTTRLGCETRETKVSREESTMTASPWKPETLDALGEAIEVDVTPTDRDGTRRASRTIWSIRVGDELYVRSWKGRGAVWFQDALATGRGELAVTGGGASQLVTFDEVDAAAPVQRQISATFLTKYAGLEETASMNEQGPLESTLRLIPLVE